jgi:hypothetical protein
MTTHLKIKSILASSLLVGLLGNIYFTSPQTVYSQSTATSQGLADTAWPMETHDPQHTNRSQFDGVVSNPKQIWETDLGSALNSNDMGGMTIGIDGTIYIAYGYYLSALDPNTGDIKWQLSEGTSYTTAPTIAQDGTLYYAADDRLFALNPDGTGKWSADLPTNYYGIPPQPILDSDGNIYFTQNGLFSFTAQGVLRWDYDKNPPNIGLSMDTEGNLYYPRSDDIDVINPKDGSLIKKIFLRNADAPTIAPDGTVYAFDSRGALDEITSQGTYWSFPPSGDSNIDLPYASPALGPDGMVYTADGLNSDNGGSLNLFSLQPDGSLYWKNSLPRTASVYQMVGNLIIDNSNRVYLCSGNGICYAYAPDGTLLWEFSNDYGNSTGQGARLIIPQNGTIILCGADGIIRAISSGEETTRLVADKTTFWLPYSTNSNSLITINLSSTGRSLNWYIAYPLPDWITSESYTWKTTPAMLTLFIDNSKLTKGQDTVIPIKANNIDPAYGTVNLHIMVYASQIFVPLAIR